MNLEKKIEIRANTKTFVKSAMNAHDVCSNNDPLVAIGSTIKHLVEVNLPDALLHLDGGSIHDHIVWRGRQQRVKRIRRDKVVIASEDVEPFSFCVADSFVECIVDARVRFGNDFQSRRLQFQLAKQSHGPICRRPVVDEMFVRCFKFRDGFDATDQCRPSPLGDGVADGGCDGEFHGDDSSKTPSSGQAETKRSGNDMAEERNATQNRHERKAREEAVGGTEDDIENGRPRNGRENPDERDENKVDAECAFRNLRDDSSSSS